MQADLRPEMIGEAGARGDELVDIGRFLAARAAALAPLAEVGLAVLRRLLGKDVFDFGVVAAGNRIGGLDAVAMVDRILIGAEFGGALGQFGVVGLARLDAVLALEQRIAQQFGISTKVLSSRWLSCSSRIDCISCGVSVRLWLWRTSSRGDMAIRNVLPTRRRTRGGTMPQQNAEGKICAKTG